MARSQEPTSFRLSEEARGLLSRLAGALGINQAAAREMAIRHLARRGLGHQRRPHKSTRGKP